MNRIIPSQSHRETICEPSSTLRVSVVLPKDDPYAEAAFVHGLELSSGRWPHAFSPNGDFGELERTDAADEFRSEDTIVLGHVGAHGEIEAAALMRIELEHVDIVDLYNNGPSGLGAAMLADALRYAAVVRDHVLIGVLAKNLAVANLYVRAGFRPYASDAAIHYFYIGGRTTIESAADALTQHGWRCAASTRSEHPGPMPVGLIDGLGWSF